MVKRIHEQEKQEMIKMLKEKERIQNTIRQMSVKMAAHRERTRSNPGKILAKNRESASINFEEYMLPELTESYNISKRGGGGGKKSVVREEE